MPGEPRGMWTSNRVCEAAVLQRKADIHRQRLREIRPTIDTRDPRRPKGANSKGARLEEERNAQIMHENTILLDKLSKILTREKTAQAGGATLPAVAAPPTAGGGLHDIYRRKVREQIDRENQALLKRLQYMKPSIDMVRFEQQWQQHAHFATMNRSQVSNPMMAPIPARRRPYTVPSNMSARRGPRAAEAGGKVAGRQTPAHYLQPLHNGDSAREVAPAVDDASYTELAAREADALLEGALGTAAAPAD